MEEKLKIKGFEKIYNDEICTIYEGNNTIIMLLIDGTFKVKKKIKETNFEAEEKYLKRLYEENEEISVFLKVKNGE